VLDGVILVIPNRLLGSLGREWKDIKRLCEDIVNKETLTGYGILGKSPTYKPPLQCSVWWL
jgi:hypothetical protein